MKSVILTGDRPTGPLHLGHYVGSLAQRLQLQERQDAVLQYLIIADIQALTDNFDNPQKVKDNILEVALDYLAVGLDPQKNTFFVQSLVPELYELTAYFMNLVTVSRLLRNPTVKTEIIQKSMQESLPVGFLNYPVSQAADILGFKADLVPAGEDQNPMIELTNEIAKRFNYLYKTQCFSSVKPLVGSVGRLSGIDGKFKMSKSAGNAIYLSDDFNVLKKKVQNMYTDPKHLRISDPGQIEGNIVFEFLDAFDCDKNKVSELKKHYKQGGLGDGVLKEHLLNILEDFISPIRKRRQFYKKDLGEVDRMIRSGSEVARNKVSQTLIEVRSAMHLY